MSLLKPAFDAQIAWVNLDSNCAFKTFYISVGNQLQSIQGLLALAVNVYFRVMQDSTATLNECLKYKQYGCVGQEVASTVALLASSQVYSYNYGQYASATADIGNSVQGV